MTRRTVSSENKQEKSSEIKQARQPVRKKSVSLADKTEYFSVHYLPNFHNDYRYDPHAEAIKVGDFPGGSDLLAEIRSSPDYVPGVFRVTAMNKERKFIKSWPLEVPAMPEPMQFEDEEEMIQRNEPIERERIIVEKPLDAATIRDIATVVAQTVADRMREATPNPEPQPSGQSFGAVLKEALSSIEALDTFKTRLVGENRQGEPQQPAQQMTEFQMLLEVAKLASESKNPDLMEMLRDYVAPQKKTSFIDSLSGIFEAAMPYIPALLQSATNNQTTQQAAPVSVVSSQPVAGPGQQYNSHAQPTAHQMPQQPVQPQMPIDPGQRSLNRVIGRMVEDCLENASVLSVASAIDDLIERYPQFSELASLLVSNSPGEVLAFAKTQFPGVDFSQAPHAEMWIKALQDELAGPTGETGQGEQTGQTTEAQAGATGGNSPQDMD